MHACGRGNHCRNFTCWRQRDENRRTYCLNPRHRTPIDSSPVRHSFDRSRALPPQLNSSRRTRLAKSNRKTKTTATTTTTTTTTKEVAENQNHHIPGIYFALPCWEHLPKTETLTAQRTRRILPSTLCPLYRVGTSAVVVVGVPSRLVSV